MFVFSSKKSIIDSTHLDERNGVDAVLGSNLKTDSAAGLGVPSGLGTSLNLLVDLVVVAGREDAQVVSSGDGGAVAGGLVADGGAVARDLGLLDVVADRGTGEETLVADESVDRGRGALGEVEEGAAVEVGLLEVQVQLDSLALGVGKEAKDTLSLEALGDVVGELELGLEGVGGVPGVGDGQACASPKR